MMGPAAAQAWSNDLNNLGNMIIEIAQQHGPHAQGQQQIQAIEDWGPHPGKGANWGGPPAKGAWNPHARPSGMVGWETTDLNSSLPDGWDAGGKGKNGKKSFTVTIRKGPYDGKGAAGKGGPAPIVEYVAPGKGQAPGQDMWAAFWENWGRETEDDSGKQGGSSSSSKKN